MAPSEQSQLSASDDLIAVSTVDLDAASVSGDGRAAALSASPVDPPAKQTSFDRQAMRPVPISSAAPSKNAPAAKVGFQQLPPVDDGRDDDLDLDLDDADFEGEVGSPRGGATGWLHQLTCKRPRYVLLFLCVLLLVLCVASWKWRWFADSDSELEEDFDDAEFQYVHISPKRTVRGPAPPPEDPDELPDASDVTPSGNKTETDGSETVEVEVDENGSPVAHNDPLVPGSLQDPMLIQEQAEARGVEPSQVVRWDAPPQLFLPSLSEVPPGSPRLAELLKKLLSVNTTYLDLPIDTTASDTRPTMKLDPWLLVNSPASTKTPRPLTCSAQQPWFTKYLARSEAHLTGTSSPNSTRYIVYSCATDACDNAQGLSEHIAGVLQAFALGLATQRVLVVNWPDSFPHVAFSTFDYKRHYLKWMEQYEHAEPEHKLAFRFEDGDGAGERNLTYVELVGVDEPGEEREGIPVREVNFVKKWDDIEYVVFEPPSVGLHLMQELYANPALGAFLNATFDRDNIWACLMNLLIKPHKPLLKAMEPYLPFLLDADVLTVGVQGRFNDRNTAQRMKQQLTPAELATLAAMTKEERAVYHQGRLQSEALNAPFACAKELHTAYTKGLIADSSGLLSPSSSFATAVAATTLPSKPLRYFFMSNSKLLRNGVVSSYPSHALVLNITVVGEVGASLPTPTRVELDNPERYRAHEQMAQLSATWMEFWLFALCDHQVVPTNGAAGSFGKLAALRAFGRHDAESTTNATAALSHIWDGSRIFHSACSTPEDGLTIAELETDSQPEQL